MEDLGFGSGSGGGGGGGAPKSASSSASSTSGNNFGGLVSDGGGLTPMAGIILGVTSLIAFVGLLVLLARR
jgi:hypothetical protein